MEKAMFQEIFNLINDGLPDTWNKLVFRADYTEGSYSMKYYVFENNGEYKDCFSLNGVSKAELIKIFMKVDRVISKERNEQIKKWSIMTMIVDRDGSMNADFSYDNIEDSSIDYHKAWEEKYLRG